MPTVNVDTSEARTFEPLPKGAYDFIISGCESKTSKGGNVYLNWTLTVESGELTGRKCWKSTPISGEGAGFLTELLEAVGYEVKSKKFGLDPQDIIGRSLVGVVDTYEYEGKLQNNVTKLLRKS